MINRRRLDDGESWRDMVRLWYLKWLGSWPPLSPGSTSSCLPSPSPSLLIFHLFLLRLSPLHPLSLGLYRNGRRILVLLLRLEISFLESHLRNFQLQQTEILFTIYFSVTSLALFFTEVITLPDIPFFLEYCRRAFHWFITCVPVKRLLRRYDALCVLARACRPLGRR